MVSFTAGFICAIFMGGILIGMVWCTDPDVEIKQTFPYTFYKDGHKRMVVHKDKDCFLACVVDNIATDKKVQWLVQNFMTGKNIPISTDTDTSDAFKYQIDKPAANNWRLRIQNIQTTDQALYICRVQIGGQQNANDSRIISVVPNSIVPDQTGTVVTNSISPVLSMTETFSGGGINILCPEPPQIIDIFTSSDTTVQEGYPEELTCNASGLPQPLISWKMVGGGVLPTGGREHIGGKLTIPSAKRDHKGAYKCIARNTAGTDERRIYLNVEFHPRVTPIHKEVYQAVGYSKELKCEANGNPIPTVDKVRWYKTDVPLLEDSGKYKFKYYFGSNYVLMKLIINDVQVSDYGRYNCYAENTEGSEENYVQLLRSDKPTSDSLIPNGAAMISYCLTTIITITATCLLHFC